MTRKKAQLFGQHLLFKMMSGIFLGQLHFASSKPQLLIPCSMIKENVPMQQYLLSLHPTLNVPALLQSHERLPSKKSLNARELQEIISKTMLDLARSAQCALQRHLQLNGEKNMEIPQIASNLSTMPSISTNNNMASSNSLIETKENEDTHIQTMPDIQNQSQSNSECMGYNNTTSAAQYPRYQASNHQNQCQAMPPMTSPQSQAQDVSNNNLLVQPPQLPPLPFYNQNNDNFNNYNSFSNNPSNHSTSYNNNNSFNNNQSGSYYNNNSTSYNNHNPFNFKPASYYNNNSNSYNTNNSVSCNNYNATHCPSRSVMDQRYHPLSVTTNDVQSVFPEHGTNNYCDNGHNASMAMSMDYGSCLSPDYLFRPDYYQNF